MTEYQAKEMGKAFLRKAQEATGGTWYLRVWNNCGWHYQLYNGRLNLSERRERDTGKFYYTILISNDNETKTAGAGYYPIPKGYDIAEVVAIGITKALEIEKERYELAQENFEIFDEQKLKDTMLKMLENAE